MAASSFDEALARLLVHEGGNDDDPRDPGGRTSRGILQREWKRWRLTHPGLPEDVWDAPQRQVVAIYRDWYWDALDCDNLPAGVDYALFDSGVNSGIGRAGRVLRRLLDLPSAAVTAAVIAAARQRDAKELIAALCEDRLIFLEGLSTWPVFGKGWARRVREVCAAALAMAGAGSSAGTNVAGKDDLAQRIVWAMQAAGYRLDRGRGELNIVYVEGMDVDGRANDNAPNRFNDLRVVLAFDATPPSDGRGSGAANAPQPRISGLWQATTEPSRFWTQTPMNPKGAARIAFGQYATWRVGTHHDHEALVQVAPVTVCRDLNKDYRREGDARDTGLFGINQHWGYDLPADDLGRSSAGCLVGRTREGHSAFMALIKSDPRYRADPSFRFTTAILPAAAVRAALVESSGRSAAPPAGTRMWLGTALAATIGAVVAFAELHPMVTALGIVASALLLAALAHSFKQTED
ncbi:MAG: hypothetical protein IT537_24535 [Hyphomicrobiales bacterium]|nr:hypothetical protein [Hyphomicrobiales bacterium]